MKFLQKIILLLSAISLLVLSNCNDPEPLSDANSAPLNYLGALEVSINHKIGESPCPQGVSTLSVKCKKGTDSCTTDSAVITNSHPGLDASFDNGLPYIKLDADPSKNNTLEVNFNCNVAMSFEHTYKVDFFKNAKKIDEEEFKVKMSVK